MFEGSATVVSSDDETLVVLARAGDQVAREELFRRHWDRSYRLAKRLLGREEDALDAVQDGFLKALNHLERFDGRCEFSTWLCRIVQNAALDLGRNRSRRTNVGLKVVTANGEEPEKLDDPSVGLVNDDLRMELDAALARLSPSLRSAFVLFAESELSYKEIAEIQGVPVGTVMSRIHAARQKLQSYLSRRSDL
jgi:RNA polymerase sigma-70 factor (ECF subfamily)